MGGEASGMGGAVEWVARRVEWAARVSRVASVGMKTESNKTLILTYTRLLASAPLPINDVVSMPDAAEKSDH